MTTTNDSATPSDEYTASVVAYLLARGRIKEASRVAASSPSLSESIIKLARILALGVESEPSRQDSGMTRAQQEALWTRDMVKAAELLAGEPVMSTRELARRLSVGRLFTCHPGRAATIRRALATSAATPTVEREGEHDNA